MDMNLIIGTILIEAKPHNLHNLTVSALAERTKLENHSQEAIISEDKLKLILRH